MYDRRFAVDEEYRKGLWETLCVRFFQRYVPIDASVLEVGAGHCEFINAIQAAGKIAVDLNAATRTFAGKDVVVFNLPSTELARAMPANSVDIAFASNFFEHLSRPEIVGHALRYLGSVEGIGRSADPSAEHPRYSRTGLLMFFDHVTPIDDRALAEVLETNGYRVEECYPRFLPYTTKSALRAPFFVVRTYLRMPWVHAFLVSRPSW